MCGTFLIAAEGISVAGIGRICYHHASVRQKPGRQIRKKKKEKAAKGRGPFG